MEFYSMPSKRVLTKEEQRVLRNLFSSDYGVQTIVSEYKISYRVIMRYWKEWFTDEEFSARCSRLNRIHKLGSNNPMYGKIKDKHHNSLEKRITTQGYVSVFKPNWWEGRSYNNRVLEHILVCCESRGLKALPKGCIVHHKDGNRVNNSEDNLELMTIGEHLRLHNTTHGKYVKKGATTIQ